MDDEYTQRTLRGIASVLGPQGARLVGVTYGSSETHWDVKARFHVVGRGMGGQSFDALIFSGGLSHQVPSPELISFYQSYLPLPVVSLAVAVPGIPSVVTRGRAGMDRLMDHLLDDHGYRRLAYLGGPAGQFEAEERWSSFQNALSRRGLAPLGVERGQFTSESGRELCQRLLDQLSTPPQAIVCAADSIALGAQYVLRRHGLEPGRDVAVTGFDDSLPARLGDPALTTVHQSLFLMAQRAADLVLRQCAGSPIPALTSLDSWFVPRLSCGCSQTRGGPLDQVRALIPKSTWPLAAGLSRLDWADPAPARLVRDIAAQSHEPTDLEAWSLYLESLAGIQREAGAREVLDRALAQMDRQQERWTATSAFLSGHFASRLRSLSETILTAFRRDEVFDALDQTLPTLEMSHCFISLFQDPLEPTAGATLLYCFREGKRCRDQEQTPFDPRGFIPHGLKSESWSSPVMIVEPLFSKTAPVGFVVLGTSLDGAGLTGTLRNSLSGALQGILELERRQEANERLRTALRELEQAQAHLGQTERLAALGQLVAGIAHEINSPLGVASLAAESLEGLVESSPVDAAAVREVSDLISRNVKRAAGLIAGFKQVAADQTSEERRVFLLSPYLEEVLESLRPQWKHTPVTVTFHGDPNLALNSYPGLIAQVVTNLVMNALHHGFPAGQHGEITLSAASAGTGAVVLTVSDNGTGIPPENLPFIFDPFFTTRRGQGGTGLGLSIVNNLVSKVLGGQVTVTPAVPHGACFTVILPRESPHTPTSAPAN